MIFEQIEEAIYQLLTTSASGRYRTANFEAQTIGAEEVQGNDRLVEVFYSAGDFDTNVNSLYGTGANHDIDILINLYVSAKAEGDLITLNDPNATIPERETALNNFIMASRKANLAMNELFRIVYLILMDGNNINLGLPKGTFANRWISNFQKNAPGPQGELFLLTGTFTYKCRAYEQFTGATPIPSVNIDVTIDQDGDDVEKTGVVVDSN